MTQDEDASHRAVRWRDDFNRQSAPLPGLPRRTFLSSRGRWLGDSRHTAQALLKAVEAGWPLAAVVRVIRERGP